MKHLAVFFFLAAGFAQAQTPSCNPSGTSWKGTFTTAAAGTSNPNNTANPNCNAFALTWNIGSPASAVTALSMQLEGSDDNSTWTAFSGTSTVLVGTNPSTSLSGAIIVQASSKLAYIRARTTAFTGSGVVNYQIYGYNGVTAAARGNSGGSGGGGVVTQTWTAGTGGVTANTPVCVTEDGTSPVRAINCITNVVGFSQISTIVLGVAQSSAAAGATFPVIVQGPATCTFDTYAPPVAGHMAIYSLKANGTCQDSGTNDWNGWFGVPNIGIVMTSGIAGSTQSIFVVGPGISGSNIDYFSPLRVVGGAGGQSHFSLQLANTTSSQGTGTVFMTANGPFTVGDMLNVASNGAMQDAGFTVPLSAAVLSSDASRHIIAAPLPSADIWVGSAGNAPVAVALSGDCTLANTGAITCAPAAINFSTIASGTNSTATMVCGTGCSLAASGTGIVQANFVPTASGATATVAGQIKYDNTNKNYHAGVNSVDSILADFLASLNPTNGNCVNWSNTAGLIRLGDAGAACGSGGTGGGGVVTYSGPALGILTGTAFGPIGGGGALSATESNVDIDSSATATVSNLYVQLSVAPGAGNSIAVTWRDNGVSQTLTCTISGAVATSCNDTTHSFTATTGDLLDYQYTFTGTILVTPTVNIMSAFGTSGVGVTNVSGTTPISSTGGTTPAISCPTCTTGTPTNHGVAIGTATQAMNYTPAPAAGLVLTGNGTGSDPTFQAAAAGGNTTTTQACTLTAPTTAGRINGDQVLCTNSPLTYALVSGAWQAFYHGNAVSQPPSQSTLTWQNQGTATATDANGGILFTVNGGTDNVRFLGKTYPTPPFTFTMGFVPNIPVGNFSFTGITVTDGTKYTILGFSYDSSIQNGVGANQTNWANATTFSSGPSGIPLSPFDVVYLTFVDDNTNWVGYISNNINDLQRTKVFTVARGSFIASPTKIGIGSNLTVAPTGTAVANGSIAIVHWTGI